MGILYIVATPLGNLEDITLRALRVLKEVDLIAAEDTRRTRKLLSHYQIKTAVISYHAHNQGARGPELIEKMQQGLNLALVSDAGTPGFSDPGALLVAQAWDAGLKVEAVPGPAAGVAVLSMSGFPGDITFLGFPPRKSGKRREFFEGLAREPRVLIFYESPQRLAGTLAEMAEHFADRQVLVVRELTKVFEEAWRGPINEVAAQCADREIKGECTLVVSCPAKPRQEEVDLAEKLLKAARETDLTGRSLAELVAAELNMPRRQVYQAYLDLKSEKRLP
jgi:16S rRNA (cytidine1402-2'-O)-methyltransferase